MRGVGHQKGVQRKWREMRLKEVADRKQEKHVNQKFKNNESAADKSYDKDLKHQVRACPGFCLQMSFSRLTEANYFRNQTCHCKSNASFLIHASLRSVAIMHVVDFSRLLVISPVTSGDLGPKDRRTRPTKTIRSTRRSMFRARSGVR